MSTLSSSNHDEYKIHISRVPTSFDETIVRRILVDHFQLDSRMDNDDDKDTLQVELIYPRPEAKSDPTTTAAKSVKPSLHHDTTISHSIDGREEDGSNKNIISTPSEPTTTHRGFGFLTLTNKEQYDKIIACPTIKGGKKPTSTKLYTMHIRPYTTSPDETNQCYLWTQGRCPYGDNCKFEHHGPGACCCVPATKPTTTNDDNNNNNNNNEASKKRGKCFAFKKGKCTKGKDCPFSHDISQPTIREERNEAKGPVPKSERDCLSWKSKGKCSKADNCPYRHDPKFRSKIEAKRKRKRQAQEGTSSTTIITDDSSHKKPKQPLCVRVFGMAYDTTREDIQAFFQDCGKIQRIEFPTFEDSGRSKGYCGVWFASPKAVEKAIEFNGQELLGRWLSVQAGKMYLKEWEANHNHSAQDEQ